MKGLSYAERVLKLYQDIDQLISQHYSQKKPKEMLPCRKGCSECCSQFFEVSEIDHIKSFRRKDIKKLVSRAKDQVNLIKNDNPHFLKQMMSTKNLSNIDLIKYAKDKYRFNYVFLVYS